MKKGLVLEGGAMRGMFTAGVIDIFMENGLDFDAAVGVSAGAAFGCNIKSRQIGRAIRYNTRFCSDRRYCSISSLIKTGDIFNTEFCYGEIPLTLDPFDFEAYEKNPMEFYTVSTDICTGRAVYHKYEGQSDHGFDWIRSSASMPLVSRTVEIEGQKLLDGGIADSIPVRFFEQKGFDKIVVILTRPGDYRKKKNPLIPIMRLKYRKYPKLVKTMENRHSVYNDTLEYIEKKEKNGEIFVIRPPEPLMVGKIERNPKKLLEAYNTGRKETEKSLEKLREFLK